MVEFTAKLDASDIMRAINEIATPAVSDVIAERQRQINVEGWTAEHDDEHDAGELALAGASCAANAGAKLLATTRDIIPQSVLSAVRNLWPWSMMWFKPKSVRSDLVKSAALIIAEIERMDRLRKPE